MTVLLILAAFYLAVLLVNHFKLKRANWEDDRQIIVNALVLAGLVFAVLACFRIIVVPALER